MSDDHKYDAADNEVNPVAGSTWFGDQPQNEPMMGVFSPRSETEFLENAQSASSGFGLKEITMFSGIVLLINNITGPGVPQLPCMFIEAGWLAPVICLLSVWVMTSISASMYTQAMSFMPGNSQFDKRYEYSTIVHYYFGRGWYIAAQIGLNGALQSLNIISVVQSAQVMDNAISAIFGKSCGLNITPFGVDSFDGSGTLSGSDEFFSCIDTSSLDNGNAWGCHVILSLGFVITAAMAIPCGRWNLDDNMIIQQVAFVLTVACWIIWMLATFTAGTEPSQALPAVNNNPQTGTLAGVVGNILFNFGFVTTVPSWVNEKKNGVPVNRSLWSATTLCIVIYLVIGLPGAYVFNDFLQGPVKGNCLQNVIDSDYNCPNDLMQLFTGSTAVINGVKTNITPWHNNSFLTFVLKTSVYLFPIVAVVSSIPVFSIVIKYNLQENGFSSASGFLWGVVFPWVVAFPLLYMPNALAQVVNFTSLVFVSFTDFIVPFSLYFVLQDRRKEQRSALLAAHKEDTEEPKLEEYLSMAEKELHESSYAKKVIAVTMGLFLSGLAFAGTYLTIEQGTYQLDEHTCALTGS